MLRVPFLELVFDSMIGYWLLSIICSLNTCMIIFQNIVLSSPDLFIRRLALLLVRVEILDLLEQVDMFTGETYVYQKTKYSAV